MPVSATVRTISWTLVTAGSYATRACPVTAVISCPLTPASAFSLRASRSALQVQSIPWIWSVTVSRPVSYDGRVAAGTAVAPSPEQQDDTGGSGPPQQGWAAGGSAGKHGDGDTSAFEQQDAPDRRSAAVMIAAAIIASGSSSSTSSPTFTVRQLQGAPTRSPHDGQSETAAVPPIRSSTSVPSTTTSFECAISSGESSTSRSSSVTPCAASTGRIASTAARTFVLVAPHRSQVSPPTARCRHSTTSGVMTCPPPRARPASPSRSRCTSLRPGRP